jgi:hypothetical protein
MNFLQNILSYRQKAAQAAANATAQPAQTAVAPTPPVETPPDAGAGTTTAPPPQPPVVRPEGMTDETYNFLTANGYSPQSIAQAYAPYNPDADGGYLTRFYQSSVAKPQQPARSNAALTVASLGDAVRTLGELYAANRGAFVSRRQPSEYSLPQVEKQARDNENRYLESMQKYQANLLDAMQNDRVYGLREYENNRNAIQKSLQNKAAEALKREDMNRRQDNENRNYDLSVQRANDAKANADRNYQLNLQRLKDTNDRADREYKRRLAAAAGKSSKSSKASTDKNGNLVLDYNVNKDVPLAEYRRQAGNFRKKREFDAKADIVLDYAKNNPAFLDSPEGARAAAHFNNDGYYGDDAPTGQELKDIQQDILTDYARWLDRLDMAPHHVLDPYPGSDVPDWAEFYNDDYYPLNPEAVDKYAEYEVKEPKADNNKKTK